MPRNQKLVVRVSPSERRLIAQMAKTEGLPESTWARSVLLLAARLMGSEPEAGQRTRQS